MKWIKGRVREKIKGKRTGKGKRRRENGWINCQSSELNLMVFHCFNDTNTTCINKLVRNN